MKTSKPYSFVLWVSDDRLPEFVGQSLKQQSEFDYFHCIKHEAEGAQAHIIKRAAAEKPKAHYHCIAHFRKPFSYDDFLRDVVTKWAKLHDEFGTCPMTISRTHEGKTNNVSTWLLYVLHNADYMRYLERVCDKPESHKTEYDWNAIHSTDYDILNAQANNAVSYLEQLCKRIDSVENAKELALKSKSQLDALLQCEDYHAMLVVSQIYRASMSARVALDAPPRGACGGASRVR